MALHVNADFALIKELGKKIHFSTERDFQHPSLTLGNNPDAGVVTADVAAERKHNIEKNMWNRKRVKTIQVFQVTM